MKSILLPLAAVVVGGAALAAGYYVRTLGGDEPTPEIIKIAKTQTDRGAGTPRPEFWLPDPAGVRHGIAEWDGKLLVMNFWATWCPPCLHEIPMFIALQERYGDRGVQFLGVAIDDGDKVRAFAEEIGLNYPTLHGQLDAIEVMTAYGNKSGGLPYTVVISRAGAIVARHPGVLDEAAAVKLIEELM
jgi:thiol-disulfide isomerase/thioredoxin